MSLLFLLLASLAQAADPCATASQITATLYMALAALPQATETPQVERNAHNAPFLAPLAKGDRGAIARMAAQQPQDFSLATAEELTRAITMLQRGGTGDLEERGILALLRLLPALERAQLLRLIDQGGDKYDLDHLVFQDVDDARRRAELLALIEEAGRALRAAGAHELGIISDIDDTVAPYGSDKGDGDRFPGAGALYHALERGPAGTGQAGDIHYVTARPPLVLGDAYRRLREAEVPVGTVDDGDLGEVIFRGERGMEREKLRDIERQLQLHPGQRFVLIGDDSQRDPEVYRSILQQHGDQVAGVYIHRVGGDARGAEDFPGVQFFDDYGQVAQDLARRGLISRADARAVQRDVAGGS